MQTRFLVIIILVLFTACQTGRIPCPKVKADKIKRSVVKRNMRYSERNVTASIEVDENTNNPRTNIIRIPGTRPPLEHIDVEEWDCPKPGSKRGVPKAVKDNIRKNRKAYETYYKNRESGDSLKVHPGGR